MTQARLDITTRGPYTFLELASPSKADFRAKLAATLRQQPRIRTVEERTHVARVKRSSTGPGRRQKTRHYLLITAVDEDGVSDAIYKSIRQAHEN